MLGYFLLFPFAFIFFSLITHTRFSFLENYLHRIVTNEILCLLLNHCKERVIKDKFYCRKVEKVNTYIHLL